MKLELGHNFKKYLELKYVSYLLIIIAVFAVMVALLPNKGQDKYSTTELMIRSTYSVNSIMEPPTEPVSISVKTFVMNQYPKVNKLVRDYYEALMTDDDKTIAKYTDQLGNIDSLKRKVNAEYIEAYDTIDCYTMTGMLENTYITVVVYKVKYKGIDTLATYMDYFYICRDLSGNLYISNKEISDEIKSYNELMFESNIVKSLQESVTIEYENALVSDPNLFEFVTTLERKD